jgi:flagellar hook-length control protein FliK
VTVAETGTGAHARTRTNEDVHGLDATVDREPAHATPESGNDSSASDLDAGSLSSGVASAVAAEPNVSVSSPTSPAGALGAPSAAPLAPATASTSPRPPAPGTTTTTTTPRLDVAAASRAVDPSASKPAEGTVAAAQPGRGGSAEGAGRAEARAAREGGEARPAPDPEKAAAVFRQLRLQLTPGTRHAVIQLAPAELGRIAIRVSVRDGRVVGEIRAESAETLAILEKHVPELRAALAQTGFEAADFDLARHGDPSPRRARASNPTPSEPSGLRATQEPASAASAPVLTEDRIDMLA